MFWREKKNVTVWKEIKKNQVAERVSLWDFLEWVEHIGSKITNIKSLRNMKKANNNSALLWDLIRMLQLLLQPLLHSKWQLYVMVSSELNFHSEKSPQSIMGVPRQIPTLLRMSKLTLIRLKHIACPAWNSSAWYSCFICISWNDPKRHVKLSPHQNAKFTDVWCD